MYELSETTHEDLKRVLASTFVEEPVSGDFLAHAQLYTFADKYMVDELKKLVLHKLHRDLMWLDPNTKTVAEVARVIQYVEANPETDAVSGEKGKLGWEVGMGPLRELVVAYAACDH